MGKPSFGNSGKRRKLHAHLQSSLKFDWSVNDSFEEFGPLLDVVRPMIEGFLEIRGKNSKKDDEYLDSKIALGLSSVLDCMNDKSAEFVFLDTKTICPGAVSKTLGMFAINCSPSTSTFPIPNLAQKLHSEFSIRCDALAFRRNSDLDESPAMLKVFVSSLKPVALKNSNSDSSQATPKQRLLAVPAVETPNVKKKKS